MKNNVFAALLKNARIVADQVTDFAAQAALAAGFRWVNTTTIAPGAASVVIPLLAGVDDYDISLSHVTPETSDVRIYVQLSYDGGSTWTTTGTSVEKDLVYGTNSYSSAPDNDVGIASIGALSSTDGILSKRGSFKNYAGRMKVMTLDGAIRSGAGIFCTNRSYGADPTVTGQATHMRIIASSGNLAGGTVVLTARRTA